MVVVGGSTVFRGDVNGVLFGFIKVLYINEGVWGDFCS